MMEMYWKRQWFSGKKERVNSEKFVPRQNLTTKRVWEKKKIDLSVFCKQYKETHKVNIYNKDENRSILEKHTAEINSLGIV